MAALSMIILVGISGAALDFGMAQLARQKLYQAASLACQYAKKTSLVADTESGGAAVRSFFNANLASQNVTTDLVNANFTAVSNGPARMSGSYAVPTTFLGLFNIASIQVSVDQQCYPVPPQLSAGAEIFKETFETPPLSTETVYNNNPGSTFYSRNFNGWRTVGDGAPYFFGLKINDGYKQPSPDGSHVGELVGYYNLSISRKLSLAAGVYELRYQYTGNAYAAVAAYAGSTRFGNDVFNNDPAPICANAAADVAWATSDTSRVGVYFSADEADFSANYLEGAIRPTSPSWRPADLIDVCIYSKGWIERSVMITVTTTGDYWLTYAGQGSNTYLEGGQLDNIRLCYQYCNGSRLTAPFEIAGQVLLRENFSAWRSAFENSLAVNDWVPVGANAFEIWDRAPSLATLPGGEQQVLELDEFANRALSHKILLPPGTYQIAYNYLSRVNFPSLGSGTIYCANKATDYPVSTLPPGTETGSFWGPGYAMPYPSFTAPHDTNAVSVWLDSDVTTSAGNRPSQMIDYCAYSSGWTTRRITVKVTKARFYWLTFKGEGTSDTQGALVADIRICAIRCDNGLSNDPPLAIAP
ncbi:MAG: hypothetical protein A4S15_11800 [Candidatus Raskinella chloraquaticus]|uniref:Uncharacterized protein n=2 Tax=Candidatus Raskinella chloraquaticus TaxID=1951219 RepID=A0A1W9HUZ9_9HYPH|nr:MAG: hypothetical protein A4S15_11800 [Proteobacteria bacterium SG_bin8]